MSKQISLVTLIVVTVIVALVTSFLTISLTGNTINVSPVSNLSATIYTKAEIDKKLAQIQLSNNTRAIACDADGVCEVRSGIVHNQNYSTYLNIDNAIFTDGHNGTAIIKRNLKIFAGDSLGSNFYLGPEDTISNKPSGANNFLIETAWTNYTIIRSIYGLMIEEAKWSIDGSKTINTNKTIISSKGLSSDNFKGTGNSYICVNSKGELYRSSTRCA